MSEDLPASKEWHEQHSLERIDKIRRNAKRLFDKSWLLNQIGDSEAEAAARGLLRVAASAFWNSEDTGLEQSTHEELDEYGRWVRETFGCYLAFEHRTYYQRCPVAIAHKRIGMSVGFTARTVLCSICGDDVSDCPHRSDTLYEVRGGVGPSGFCPVCGSSECQEHSAEENFRVPPIRIITRADLHEVSFVRKPAYADARLTSIPVDMKNLRDVLGPTFREGSAVSCDRCLRECRGIEELESLS